MKYNLIMSLSIKIQAKDQNNELKWFDITEALEIAGTPLPSVVEPGVYPDKLLTNENDTTPRFYNLLGAVHATPVLRDTFFDGKVHPIQFIDSDGQTYDLRLLLQTRYTSRNN